MPVNRCLSTLIIGCLTSVPVHAQAALSFDTRSFELRFEKNSKDLSQTEATVNEEALDRIAKLLGRIKDWRDVRLVFVGPRPHCEADANCNPEQLTWLRVNRVLEKAKDRVKGDDSGARRLPVAIAFSDEINARDISSAPESLTLLLEHNSSSENPCGTRVSLLDASLPRSLSSGRTYSSFVLNNGENVPVGDNAEVQFSEAASKSVIVWEDTRGRFRKQDFPETGQSRLLPYGAKRLYVIANSHLNGEISRFVLSLGGDFAALPRPSFLPTSKGENWASLAPSDRGFDDNPVAIPPRTIRPRPRDAIAIKTPSENGDVAVCDFEFVWR
ncbi:hypothetical protein Rvan_1253 [Rhodomicrobium vannielii ATCC 17100]|uniref:Uncharacterized protein n=1 Tax=Rhodomicrobium vannielii (strain ATCC 17100 / DSM 162 / LMG 4299 / NCIMB 10020 / ATH 3.1.1) TaxID=648757 RepID=E3I567_RHOVT|nr:hypothetical protein [Rhodomicrobium vannielii]ADP70517.1 hypothetical protein Rvan_1253 [Rhodomicrobium vannielii ATCC 17100]